MATQGSTGLCRGSTTAGGAAVAARAAFSARPSGACPNPVSMRLPRGASAQFGLVLAAGHGRVAVATGATSERAAPRFYDLPGRAMIEIGDVAGDILKYLRTHPQYLRPHPIERPPIAAGHRDRHCGRSRADLGAVAERLVALGADAAAIKPAPAAVGAGELRAPTGRWCKPLAADVGSRTPEVTPARLSGETAVVDRQGGLSALVGS